MEDVPKLITEEEYCFGSSCIDFISDYLQGKENVESLAEILDVYSINPRFVLQMAVFARDMNIEFFPHYLLLAVLAIKDSSLWKEYIDKIIKTAEDVYTFTIFADRYETSNLKLNEDFKRYMVERIFSIPEGEFNKRFEISFSSTLDTYLGSSHDKDVCYDLYFSPPLTWETQLEDKVWEMLVQSNRLPYRIVLEHLGSIAAGTTDKTFDKALTEIIIYASVLKTAPFVLLELYEAYNGPRAEVVKEKMKGAVIKSMMCFPNIQVQIACDTSCSQYQRLVATLGSPYVFFDEKLREWKEIDVSADNLFFHVYNKTPTKAKRADYDHVVMTSKVLVGGPFTSSKGVKFRDVACIPYLINLHMKDYESIISHIKTI